MLLRIKHSELIATFLIAVFSLAIMSPVMAQTEHSAYATLVFGVGALNQITVYQYTTNKGAMTAAGLALTNIEFNSSTSDQLWANGTVAGGNSQDETHPIVYVANTGTTNAALNLSAEADIASIDSCLKCFYIYNQSNTDYSFYNGESDPTSISGTGTVGAELNGTHYVQLDSSFTPNERYWGVWLYGNFSACSQGEDSTDFFMNATFA